MGGRAAGHCPIHAFWRKGCCCCVLHCPGPHDGPNQFKSASARPQVLTAGGGAANPKWTEIRQQQLGVPVRAAEQGEAGRGAMEPGKGQGRCWGACCCHHGSRYATRDQHMQGARRGSGWQPAGTRRGQISLTISTRIVRHTAVLTGACCAVCCMRRRGVLWCCAPGSAGCTAGAGSQGGGGHGSCCQVAIWVWCISLVYGMLCAERRAGQRIVK